MSIYSEQIAFTQRCREAATAMQQRKQAFQDKYHLKALSGLGCWHKVFGKRTHGTSTGECRGPYADHSNMFKDLETGEIVWTEQPYSTPNVQTVEAFAQAHGLRARISKADSWHYPGSTVLIEYRRAQE